MDFGQRACSRALPHSCKAWVVAVLWRPIPTASLVARGRLVFPSWRQGESAPGTTYQVVNFDDFSDCVWVRRWPLDARSSATFAVHGSEIRPQVAELGR